MQNKDEYLVEIFDGSKYYFKNGKLHRENGPAITPENYRNFGDEHLYKEEIVQSGKGKYITYTGIGSRGEKVLFFVNWTIAYTLKKSHYLNGQPYSPEQFPKALAQYQLNQELPLNNTQTKKVKI